MSVTRYDLADQGDTVLTIFEDGQYVKYADIAPCKCGHGKHRHTIDAPTDYMGCVDCGCSEYSEANPEGGK